MQREVRTGCISRCGVTGWSDYRQFRSAKLTYPPEATTT